MQWYKIMKPERTEDLCISEYSMEELTPLVIENNEFSRRKSPGIQDPNKGNNPQEEEQANQIGGKLSAIERDAYARGFASGEQAGHELGLKKVDGMLQGLKQLLDALNDHQENLFKRSEEDILVLVMATAQRVICEKLSQNQEYVINTIKKAAHIIGQNESITVRLHPKTLEKLSSDLPEMTQLFKAFKTIQLEPDVSLLPGECTVESSHRMIDARIESQISTLAKALSTMEPSEDDEQ
ncbi:MAG: FliH/SctL family protein [Nitrospiria bacterium]